METRKGIKTSVQISIIDNIPAGDFSIGGEFFLLKNITDEAIDVQVVMASSDKVITTKIYPGWNPEVVKEVKGVTANQLQYGY